jgi:hypothetical protein
MDEESVTTHVGADEESLTVVFRCGGVEGVGELSTGLFLYFTFEK